MARTPPRTTSTAAPIRATTIDLASAPPTMPPSYGAHPGARLPARATSPLPRPLLIHPRAGDPASAEALRAQRRRIADRAIAFAAELDPTWDARYDAIRTEDLRLDVDSMVNRMADAVAANHPDGVRRWAEMVVPRFRKKRVPRWTT